MSGGAKSQGARTPTIPSVARRLVAIAAVLALTNVALPRNVAAQDQLPSDWIDISDRGVQLEELAREARRVATSDSFWVGYTFPLREGVYVDCDEQRGRTMSFGSDGARLYFDDDGNARRGMSCDERFGVFFRFDDGDEEIARARIATLRRSAERMQGDVVWGGEFGAEQSVAFLRPVVLGEGAGAVRASTMRVRERLLAAVAVHAGEAPVAVVYASVNPSQPEDLRESGVFWLSQVGGDDGLQRLLEMARSDSSSEVRKQSIFWLGQVAGERATAHLAEIAQDDPDVDVRTSAVFALSQSDDDAAIDSLVRIVRTHDNREVVKAALFWLGQSGDPRVIELLEELLFGGRD